MTVKLFIVCTAIVVSGLFSFACTTNALGTLPGLRCEGFGCIGTGSIYASIACAIPILFALAGFILGGDRRALLAVFGFTASICAVLAAISAIFFINRMQISADQRKYKEACLQHPNLCPAKTPDHEAGKAP